MSITVNVKCSNADKYEVSTTATATVLEFKDALADVSGVAAADQRLIYKGRVLKDDLALDFYGVEDGQTVHLVKSGKSRAQGSTPASTPTPNNASSVPPSSTTQSLPQSQPQSQPNLFSPFGSTNPAQQGAFGLPDMSQMQNQLMQNPEMMQQMLNSPMMESLLSNPELMQNMMLSNPQLQPMLDANPQIRHILNDPAMMRQTLDMMRNPAAMQQAMRNQDLAMANLENHPEGFNALRRMYEDVQEPLMEATQQQQQGQGQSGSSTTSTNPWATGAPNTSALPNPWGAPAATNTPPLPTGNPFSGMGSMGGMGMGGMPNMSPAQMQQMMQNPMVQQMLQDPQLMQQMMQSNPQVRTLMQSNPQVAQMMSDPEALRRMMDPANMQAMMQLQQSMQQLQQSGLMPSMGGTGVGGFGSPPATSGGAFNWGSMGAGQPQSQQQSPVSSGGNIGGLDFSALLGGGSGNTTATPPVPPPALAIPPEQRFAEQLTQLEGMGFGDRAANIRALTAAQGNVNAAVERLLMS